MLRGLADAVRAHSAALALAVLVSGGTACGGASVPNGPDIEVRDRGDCDVERYSEPPSDQGRTPPPELVRPTDTPQPGCPGAD